VVPSARLRVQLRSEPSEALRPLGVPPLRDAKGAVSALAAESRAGRALGKQPSGESARGSCDRDIDAAGIAPCARGALEPCPRP